MSKRKSSALLGPSDNETKKNSANESKKFEKIIYENVRHMPSRNSVDSEIRHLNNNPMIFDKNETVEVLCGKYPKLEVYIFLKFIVCTIYI